MMRQKITTILGGVVVFACVANAGFAQTPATTRSKLGFGMLFCRHAKRRRLSAVDVC